MNTKTALITGGSTGIGRRTAWKMAEQNINVIVNYRTSDKQAIELCESLTEKYGTKNMAIQADITNEEECHTLIKQSLEKMDTIDILIHNAGPYIHDKKKMVDYSLEEWSYLMNGNLQALFLLGKAVIPHMRKRGWGRIITIGFDRAETAPGWMYRSAFAASKSGVVSLTRSIALEEAESGITANMVCPGDITGQWKECDIEEASYISDHKTPVGRPGTGEDVARVIAFLTEEKSSFITGSVIPVTGGKDVLGKNLHQ